MACAVRDLGATLSATDRCGEITTPVIADAGDDAWVVLVRSDHPVEIGNRFDFAGLEWEVVRGKSSVRGFVAWPVLRWREGGSAYQR